ncbi:MAG: hypothetical protein PVH88_15480 [Ignavibacteria bacterium]
MIRQPELIIADEPTGEVDDETAELIIDLMLNDQLGIKPAFIIATHGHFPRINADRVLELNEGTIADFSLTSSEITG